MTYSVTATYTSESAKLEGSYPVDMYVVNASLSGWEPLYYVNLNQDVVGYSLNATGELTKNATIYSGLPIDRSDIGTNNTGEIGELSITIPNTDRVMESIIQTRSYLRGRDIHVVSGFARHLPSVGIIDDETGASWGPTAHGLSLANGQAFFKASGVDLSPHVNKNYKIILSDTAGKIASGYIDAADAGETLGSELLFNGDCSLDSFIKDAAWTYDGTNDEYDCAAGAGVHLYQTLNTGSGYPAELEAGKLYKIVFTVKNYSAGSVRPFVLSAVGTSVSASGTYTQYFTATATGVGDVGLESVSGTFVGSIDDVSFKEVTHTAATGIHIVSSAGGTTRNWTSIESGFNYNDSSYTFDITYNIGYVLSDKYIGIAPDKNSFLKEKMYIDSVTSDEQAVVFNCKSKFNIRNVVLPKRSYYKECTWAIMGNYLGSSCDPQDTINTASYPTCDGTLDNCRKRHNSGRFGGFPSIPRRGIVII